MRKHILLLLMMALPVLTYGQLDCSKTPPTDWNWRGGDGFWMGYAFQLSKEYKANYDTGREFGGGDANPQYKGYLKYGASGLPASGLNFDLDFGGGAAEDETFFKTDAVNKSNDNLGCDVQLQYFGVVLRAVYIIPAGQGGVYRFTIGSDDGSSLRVKRNGVLETVHDNWSEGKTYIYEENIINSYREYEAGERLELFLSFYEIEGFNRLSFKFERYFGPGEIEGNQDICRIAPNPAPFTSKAPAVFAEGGSADITYQWQSTRDLESDNWENVEGAVGLHYDIPIYSPADSLSVKGIWYYQRKATMANADTTISIASNEVTLKLGFVTDLDREEFGDNSWIGHVYKGLVDFNDPTSEYNSYLGRFYEESQFRQQFRHPGHHGNFLDYRFPLDEGGCELVTTDFSIRYKMKMDVVPATYTFRVNGDDRFRLYANGVEIISSWENGPLRKIALTFEYTVEEKGQLELVMDYYENTESNEIDFSYTSIILPLEWGRVKAEACGQNNCLTWETIQEKNTSHFELERSYDGIRWEMFDNSVQAQGMSTEKVNYAFTDTRFLSSLVYYRIKQLDLDGSFAYSDVMRVVNNSFARRLRPYPNPTLGKIRFSSPGEVSQLTLFNNTIVTDRALMFERVHDDIYEADLTGIKNGNYFLKVQHIDGGTEVFKIIKK